MPTSNRNYTIIGSIGTTCMVVAAHEIAGFWGTILVIGYMAYKVGVTA